MAEVEEIEMAVQINLPGLNRTTSQYWHYFLPRFAEIR